MAKGMNGSSGMSPRKSMAVGKSSVGGGDSFGVTPGLYTARNHNPDAKMGHSPLDDGARGVGKSVRNGSNKHPAQAAPNHGPMNVRK